MQLPTISESSKKKPKKNYEKQFEHTQPCSEFQPFFSVVYDGGFFWLTKRKSHVRIKKRGYKYSYNLWQIVVALARQYPSSSPSRVPNVPRLLVPSIDFFFLLFFSRFMSEGLSSRWPLESGV